MMMNLFNIFDPSTTIMNLNLNWLSTMMIIIIMPNFLWTMPNRINMIFMIMMKTLNKEMLMLYKSKNIKSPSFMFISLFMFILLNNFISLFPYIFSSSSHMIFSMSMAMPFWLFYILSSIFMNTKNMISHLIPLNTPIYLSPLMTLIETMSILIRPLSLSIRLTANLIAGHLLMTLLNFNSLMLIIILIQMFMMMFELCVAFIQSYVFSILTSLYSSE
uniref:ATP synthase subunit a n=2 Tax=Kaburagia rhusicola TaxID=384835 RepID=A0A1Z1MWF7_9HEMI|nr:ATP synthase F0 subunit 6 [Kaburagia rhusicola ovogallis]ARW70291.1 ATP synthase F0 subunit 6 [Kaburagia rhusicola ensigallis]ARW70317.1 ATP synthase F0 subunit 6 [Kaburagia rhusicola ovogallis]UIE11119.1 ATP synthase F0 subunit 6 [Kaburagia rhusicola ovogallis]UIE11132.1 ATP synthase F0 subunit 6 [Kaburagia rhusicola ovogallis]UIE11145.1 ATP synthase F0 subunit 6 [Kaburagia rhusicola ovogallis]